MIYGQAAGERVLLGWVVLFDERSNKIIIKIKIIINTHINKESKQSVELDQKTRPKKGGKCRKKM